MGKWLSAGGLITYAQALLVSWLCYCTMVYASCEKRIEGEHKILNMLNCMSCQTLSHIKMAVRMLRTKVGSFQHHVRGCVAFSTERPKLVTVGIDFGCKNSRVAITNSLVPHLVDSELGRFTPSYVTFTQQNSYAPYKWSLQHLDPVGKCVAVGELAKRKMWRQPEDVVYNIKSLTGKQFEDPSVQEMRRRVHFSIIEGPGGEAWVGICGMEFSPVDITTAIFQKLKDIVLMDHFQDELQAVISVPAFFDEMQKEHIKSAAHRAGFKLLQLIDEPIAAALSSITIEDGIVVVFGMGAGSYNVTILCVSPDRKIEIRTQFADTSIGGDQFDDKLVDFIGRQILEGDSIDIRGDIYAMTMVAEAVEQAKVELSSKSEVTVSVPSFSTSAQGPVDLNINISRPLFEDLVKDLIGQIKGKCQSILEDAKVSTKDIKEIVLIGGMTRVPKIQGIICEVFGQNLNTKVNPEEAVVLGSAIQAALVVEDEQEISDDMIPLSIGFESSEGIFTKVIPRHSTIPTKQTVKFPTWLDYGERKCIRIFFGEHVMVQHNIPLGETELIRNRGSFKGRVDLELTLEVDKDYVVKVRCAGDEAPLCFPINAKDRLKESVDKAVKRALQDSTMIGAEVQVHARVRNLARHITNTLDDVLSVKKDELPEDLCKEALNALADLKKSLDVDVAVLKAKMLSAKSVESKILNWLPPSELHDSDHEDYEYRDA